MNSEFFEVAVNAPLQHNLTYKNDHDLSLQAGQFVEVPLGKRSAQGVVLAQLQQAPTEDIKFKSVKKLVEDWPMLPPTYLQWSQWLAKYYCHPLGQVLSLGRPPLKKQSKPRKSKRQPVVPEVEHQPAPELTLEQKQVLSQISVSQEFQAHLLHGVTGSGKTEVYLHLIEKVLARGQQALFLLPEISLTPQLVQRFSARFPNEVAVIHSQLTDREKTNQWWSVIDGDKKILIGARSALFCPIKNIGIVVVDEEHEPSFKQDEKLKYHGRDAAVMLAKFHNCPVVLGSATPSLESWQNQLAGKYQLHEMKNRVSDRKMPIIDVVNMKDEREDRREKNSELPFWLSNNLYIKMQNTLAKKQQVALFLNRRGVAQTVSCPDCAYVYECPNCAISLTLHGKSHLVCHYCDYSARFTENCPQCDSTNISPLGLGTELVEQDVSQLFPDANIARADRDEIQKREDLEKLIQEMEDNKIDILIGTQMIAKGLDFPGLALVGLVMADVGFHVPDFRASERSFQLLTQVCGRAGRHLSVPGEVVIQTYTPEHISVYHTEKNDYAGFANRELALRQELNYPPFGKLTSVRVLGANHDRALATANKLVARAQQLKSLREPYSQIQILGPTQAAIAKIRGKFRYHVLIKSPDAQENMHFTQELSADLSWADPGTKVQFDVDPINML